MSGLAGALQWMIGVGTPIRHQHLPLERGGITRSRRLLDETLNINAFERSVRKR